MEYALTIICDLVSLMREALADRFARFMEGAGTGEDIVFSAGEFNAYCRKADHGPGSYFVRAHVDAPPPHLAHMGPVQLSYIRLSGGYVGCIPREAALALDAAMRPAVPARDERTYFLAELPIRPRCIEGVYVFQSNPPTGAMRSEPISNLNVKRSQYLAGICRRVGGREK